MDKPRMKPPRWTPEGAEAALAARLAAAKKEPQALELPAPPALLPPSTSRIEVLRVTALSVHAKLPAWLLGGNVEADTHWVDQQKRTRLCRAVAGPCIFCEWGLPTRQMVYLPILFAFAWPRTSLAILPVAETAAAELLHYGGRGLTIELSRFVNLKAGIRAECAEEQFDVVFDLPVFDAKPVLLRMFGDLANGWPVAAQADGEKPPDVLPFKKAEGA